MMVLDQDIPLRNSPMVPSRLAGAPFDDAGAVAAAAESAGTPIDRTVQDLHDAVIGRLAPDDPA